MHSNGVNGDTVSPTPASSTPELPAPQSIQNGRPPSAAGSISPLRRDSDSPGVGGSASPARRQSFTPSSATNSRGVSPVDTRRVPERLVYPSPLSSTASFSKPPPRQQPNGAQHKSPLAIETNVNGQLSEPRTQSSVPPVHQPTSQQSPQKTSPPHVQRFTKRFSVPIYVRPRPPQPPPAVQTETPEEEVDEEVIEMSPATSAPIMSYRRSRASFATPSSSTSHLPGNGTPLDAVSESNSPAVYRPKKADGSHHDPGQDGEASARAQPYFGQRISQFDLIANNIENAFVAMR